MKGQREDFRLSDAQLAKDSPVGMFEVLGEEGEQGELGRLHGAGAVAPMFAQVEEVSADLVLGEGGRIALVMFGELADVPEVLLFGGRPEVFQIDKLFELLNRRMVEFHRVER